MLNNDLAPALAELGAAVPTYDPDGISLVPLLEDAQAASWHRNSFLVEHWYVANSGPATYFSIRYKNSVNDLYYSEIFEDLSTPGRYNARDFCNMKIAPYQMSSAHLGAGELGHVIAVH